MESPPMPRAADPGPALTLLPWPSHDASHLPPLLPGAVPPVRAAAPRRAAWPVALVAMPFLSIRRPSIQIGLLKAIAEAHGFPTQTFHLNLEFARPVGLDLYERLCEHRGPLLGDWLFSAAAFGADAPDRQGHFLDEFEGTFEHLFERPDAARGRLLALRDVEVPAYLDRLMRMVPWGGFRVVGFTSTFQQNAAALALARRIKESHPTVAIVFGGANFDGGMGVEYLRATPWIDYAVIGEADEAFPELLAMLQEGREPAAVPGVAWRRNGAAVPPVPRAPVARLDDLPLPDYGEYFDRVERLGVFPEGTRPSVAVPFETSRGCWWGEKHHCTFCGLNGATMRFRSKSPDRVLRELSTLARRHGTDAFEAVDNILDPSYLSRLLPDLARERPGYRLFYEIKANLTRDQVRLLRDAGVRSIQPGIESLSTRVLKLMRKGVSALQNVNLLRWCRYYDVEANWNLLWGFPGETAGDYAAQVALLPLLAHLRPPHGVFRIWMERFSPLFFDREAFPVRWMRPDESYAYIYPPHTKLEQIAYFFDYELEDHPRGAVYERIADLVRAWRARWAHAPAPALAYRIGNGVLEIDDRRGSGQALRYTFEGPAADLYVACGDRPTTAAHLARSLGAGEPVGAVEEALALFCSHGLMVREGEQFLALALPEP